MARKLTPKQQQVVNQLLLDPSLKRCSEVTGVDYEYVRKLHTKAHILEILDEKRQKIAAKAEIDAAWVLREQVKIYERCMTVHPILDKEGNPIGQFKFDAAGANRALELIGKHKAVNAFKETDGDGEPIDRNWVMTFVYTSKEEYDQRKKCIEHNP